MNRSNPRQLKQLLKRADLLSRPDLVSLLSMGRQLAGTLDQEALLRRILEVAAKLTSSPDAAIILHDKERDTLYFAHAIGSKAAFLLREFGEQATRQVPWDSKAGEVFRRLKTEVRLALEKDPAHFKGVDEVTRKKTESMITVPLLAGEECVGVMQILNKRGGDYDNRDTLLLEQFALQAALALRNASLIGDLLAHMGLYSKGRNRRNAQDLVRLLSMPPRVENMTVMFADLRGFSRLSEQSGLRQLTRKLSEFLSMLVDQVLSHDGVVNKHLGDGILACFRNSGHELAAVDCAFAMIDAFGPIKEGWIPEYNRDISYLDIGIGICTDDAIIGPIGSKRVKDFSVIGNVVNLAAAFEHQARGGKQVLVDQRTYSKVQHRYKGERVKRPIQSTGSSYVQFHLSRSKPREQRRAVWFISYSHEDQAFVDRHIVAVLEHRGIQTWISRTKMKQGTPAGSSIRPGKQWMDEITKGLQTATRVLVIVSKNSARSDWVKREVHVAMTLPHLKDRIIPVWIDRTPLAKVDLILSTAQAINYQDLSKLEDDEPAV